MKFTEGLKKNQEFQEVYKKGVSRANRYFVMYVSENHRQVNRLGVSVSKKVGNSVVRHRVKRLVKESYRLHEDIFNSGLNIAVIARAGAAFASYREVESAILHLGKLHGILKRPGDRAGAIFGINDVKESVSE
ncbi:MAG TPA: ribonuclease P protein component [Lachnospiraceae bacterium]|nr:ribonuclease P protein component [Lachnospiraceae bacterium]